MSNFTTIDIIPNKDLIFDFKVREMCKTCKRFGVKATCPPYIDSFEYYEKVLKTYSHGLIYYKVFENIDLSNWIELGKSSSRELAEELNKKRSELLNQGHYFISIFGGGSCKICDKCSFPCKFPSMSIIPVEATGIDVVKLMNLNGITLSFPVTDCFYRVGLVLYD
jgi:predicted metal-binding protein